MHCEMNRNSWKSIPTSIMNSQKSLISQLGKATTLTDQNNQWNQEKHKISAKMIKKHALPFFVTTEKILKQQKQKLKRLKKILPTDDSQDLKKLVPKDIASEKKYTIFDRLNEHLEGLVQHVAQIRSEEFPNLQNEFVNIKHDIRTNWNDRSENKIGGFEVNYICVNILIIHKFLNKKNPTK